MWNGKTCRVVLPTYNERDSIGDVHPGIRQAGPRRRHHRRQQQRRRRHLRGGRPHRRGRSSSPRQGYGAAIRRGLVEADIDLICVCEPDGTFKPEDLIKLLPFTPDATVVGSRTVSNFIWTGANMGRFLQWGNWAVAKIIELLFNTSYLSDVGCTFRVISRERPA